MASTRPSEGRDPGSIPGQRPFPNTTPWRNWLAHPVTSREAGGSKPPGVWIGLGSSVSAGHPVVDRKVKGSSPFFEAVFFLFFWVFFSDPIQYPEDQASLEGLRWCVWGRKGGADAGLLMLRVQVPASLLPPAAAVSASFFRKRLGGTTTPPETTAGLDSSTGPSTVTRTPAAVGGIVKRGYRPGATVTFNSVTAPVSQPLEIAAVPHATAACGDWWAVGVLVLEHVMVSGCTVAGCTGGPKAGRGGRGLPSVPQDDDRARDHDHDRDRHQRACHVTSAISPPRYNTGDSAPPPPPHAGGSHADFGARLSLDERLSARIGVVVPRGLSPHPDCAEGRLQGFERGDVGPVARHGDVEGSGVAAGGQSHDEGKHRLHRNSGIRGGRRDGDVLGKWRDSNSSFENVGEC